MNFENTFVESFHFSNFMIPKAIEHRIQIVYGSNTERKLFSLSSPNEGLTPKSKTSYKGSNQRYIHPQVRNIPSICIFLLLLLKYHCL